MYLTSYEVFQAQCPANCRDMRDIARAYYIGTNSQQASTQIWARSGAYGLSAGRFMLALHRAELFRRVGYLVSIDQIGMTAQSQIALSILARSSGVMEAT